MRIRNLDSLFDPASVADLIGQLGVLARAMGFVLSVSPADATYDIVLELH